MRVNYNSVPRTRLTSVLSPAGASMQTDAPLVSYAKSCLINGQLVPHLVVQGADGPVTVLVLPNEKVDGPISIMRNGLEGVIVPVEGGGSVAIIGRDAASVESVRQQTQESLAFDI